MLMNFRVRRWSRRMELAGLLILSTIARASFAEIEDAPERDSLAVAADPAELIRDGVRRGILPRRYQVAQAEAEGLSGAPAETSGDVSSEIAADVSSVVGASADYRSTDPDAWRVLITPDGWLSSLPLTGDVTVAGVTSEVDLGFSEVDDVISSLDMAAALYVEVGRGPWFVFGNIFYMELSGGGGGSVDIGPLINRSIGPISLRGSGVSIDVEAEAKLTQAIAELAGGRRVFERPIGDAGSGRRFFIDLFAGARYWYMKTELDVDIKATAGGLTLSAGPFARSTGSRSRSRTFHLEESKEWVDPFVGFRTGFDITEKLSTWLRGDVGGFGVGSDFSWKAGAGLDYSFTPNLSAFAGYRAIGVDYEDGDFELDLIMGGPVIGFAYEFGGRS